jgi:hypothetical protein
VGFKFESGRIEIEQENIKEKKKKRKENRKKLALGLHLAFGPQTPRIRSAQHG